MSQYFENDKKIEHRDISLQYHFGANAYTFSSDNGVFSKGHIDPESALLMAQIPALNGSLLDLGCGYGCIGICLAKEYGLVLTQVDCNERALELCAENAKANGVESEILLSDCYSALGTRCFDTITLNPPIHAGKAVTYKMYEEAPLHLNDGGCLYIVTLKKHGAESTIRKLNEVFGSDVEVIYKKSGNYVIKCTKNNTSLFGKESE